MTLVPNSSLEIAEAVVTTLYPMKKMDYTKIPTPGNIALIVIVGVTGYIFVQSWYRHSPGIVGRGIIFALAVISVFAFEFLVKDKK